MARARVGHQALFPFWEAGGDSICPVPGCTRWGLDNGDVRRLTRYGPAAYFPGRSANEVETADGNPVAFASDEPYILALVILWAENPGSAGIFPLRSLSNGDWL
ncbi:MAG: hypothetical protein ACREJ5_17040 [Geminicoccaceae bacterium]